MPLVFGSKSSIWVRSSSATKKVADSGITRTGALSDDELKVEP